MKIGTERKLKFRKLKRKLGLADWEINGVLTSLWNCTAENCMQGDIGRFSNEDIASLIEWSGDADELVEALVDCRWLDESDEHRLVVHDWHEHAPNWLKGNLARRNLKFASSPAESSESPSTVPKDVAKQGAKEQAAKQPAIKSSQVMSCQFNSGQEKQRGQVPPKQNQAGELDSRVLDSIDEILRAVGTPLDEDHRFLGQLGCVMATRTGYGPQIRDAINSVKASSRRPRSPCAYIRQCLNETIGKRTLDRLLRCMSRKKVEPYLAALSDRSASTSPSSVLSNPLNGVPPAEVNQQEENRQFLRKLAASEAGRPKVNRPKVFAG